MRAEHPRDAWARLALGNWLRRWRLSTGASQRRAASLASIDQSFLSRVERGHRRMSGDTLARLIITLDWLSGGGLPEGPYAAIHHSLPATPSPLPGRTPPVVVGTALLGEGRPLVPATDWLDAQQVLHRADTPRASPLQPPTIAEALAIRIARR